MADSSVQQSGGDFTTLAAALADAGTVAGDTITISGTWSVADTAECVVADNNVTITATGSSRVTTTRHVAGSPDHYRLVGDLGGTHVITVNNTGCKIDGLDIFQNSSGGSDECIRMAIDTGTLTVENCVLQSSHTTNDQDGIYAGDISCTINVTNCIIYNFDRAGLNAQIFVGTHTQTWNINSCTIYQCGETGEVDGGGIVCYREDTDGSTYNMNVHNTGVYDSSIGASDYTNTAGARGTATWGVSYSIDSDNSIASVDGGGTGNLASRTLRDAQSAAPEVLVKDITGSVPFDLSLIDDSTNNDAQDAHAVATAEGLTIPSTDIDGTSRPQNTNYDIGAFEIIAVGGADVRKHIIPAYMRQNA